MSIAVRAFICGLSGLALTLAERIFLQQFQPWGVILFARNVDSPAQVKALISDVRAALARPDAPILVDQEGGRVQRLRPPHWGSYPPAAHFGVLYQQNPQEAVKAAHASAFAMAQELAALGITITCAPVLDVPIAGSHDVIGDRAFSHDPAVVAALGAAFAQGILAAGVLPVMKHMPGHGRALADSHHALPMVDAPLQALMTADFVPFKALASTAFAPIAMSAHVIYTVLDAARPATISPLVIESIIRGHIGFDGLLLSDDVSMQALSGTLDVRTMAALDAGIDIVLHCNGKLDEAALVASAAPVLAGKARERAAFALSKLPTTGA